MNYLPLFFKYFHSDSLFALVAGILLFICALVFFRKKIFWLKTCLFAGGVCMAYFACSLDMFLHDWDEQYHALVAKNMMSDLFNPVLYRNELLPGNSHLWILTHIWLHKQPLFLWQMALSLRIFGLSELALRVPNMIAHGFLAVMIFDMGRIIKNETTGIIAAIVFCCMKFPLTYAAGMYATDHNDYMFLFYVTVSFWSLLKYHESGKNTYLVLTGIFSGCAILVKWLTGLLAIGIWGSYSIIFEWKKITKVVFAFLIAAAIVLPWQIYCYLEYKYLFLGEMSFNSRHFIEALDGHEGKWYYHFKELKNLYADTWMIYLILAFSFLWFLFSDVKKIHKYFVLISISVVYGFFSFAQTRMPAFCIIVIPFAIITFASVFYDLLQKIKPTLVRRTMAIILLSQIIILFFSPSYFIKRHTLSYAPEEHDMSKRLYEKNVILALGEQFKDQKVVFINARGMAIRLMYYLDCDAANDVPSEKIIDELKNRGYKLIALHAGLPDYIRKDRAVLKLANDAH